MPAKCSCLYFYTAPSGVSNAVLEERQPCSFRLWNRKLCILANWSNSGLFVCQVGGLLAVDPYFLLMKESKMEKCFTGRKIHTQERGRREKKKKTNWMTPKREL